MLCLGLFAAGIGLQAQLVLEPSIGLRDPLHPDSLAAFASFAEAYDAVQALDLPLDSLNDEQFALMMQEGKRESPPWSTATYGCSFYCGNGPEKLWASSFLRAGSSMAYPADLAHDFDLRTAWVEGVEGHGIGESIHMNIPLNPSVYVTRVLISNGYAKSLQAWRENGRVKKFGLYANGRLVAELALMDTPREQSFAIGMLNAGTRPFLELEFRILEVYPGEKYPDTAISEINLDGVGHH